MSFGSANGPTLKTAFCHIRALVGRMINIKIGKVWGSSEFRSTQQLGEYSVDGGDQAGFGVVGGHVGDVLNV